MSANAVSAYNKIRNGSEIESADPHRLIQMLIDGALEKMIVAKAMMLRKDIAHRGEQISWAISIISGLKASIDYDKGGELAANLAALYDYVTVRLVQASAENDPDKLEEAMQVMRTLKEGWDGIRPQAVALFSQQRELAATPA